MTGLALALRSVVLAATSPHWHPTPGTQVRCDVADSAEAQAWENWLYALPGLAYHLFALNDSNWLCQEYFKISSTRTSP